MKEFEDYIRELGLEDCPQATGESWAKGREVLIKNNLRNGTNNKTDNLGSFHKHYRRLEREVLQENEERFSR